MAYTHLTISKLIWPIPLAWCLFYCPMHASKPKIILLTIGEFVGMMAGLAGIDKIDKIR